MADEKKPTDEIVLPGTLSESLQATHEALSKIGTLSQTQFSGLDRLTKIFAAEHLGSITAATRRLDAMFSGLDRFAKIFPKDHLRSITAATRALHDEFSAVNSFTKRLAEQMEGVDALGDSVARINSVFAEQAFAFSRLADQMRPVLPKPLFPALDRKLFEAIKPSAALLGTLGESSGVLTSIEGVDDVVGTVSWASPKGDIHAAGILDRPPSAGERLDIEVAIKCGLCGELMPVPQRSVEWQSPTKALINVKVLPVCPRCVHEVQGSPEYWIEKFDALQRPQLKLIRGDGQSPEFGGRDHLRLVEGPDGEES